jgi:hypothetical protein
VDTKGITVVQVRNTDSLLSFSACIHNDNRCNRYGNNFHIMETKIFNDIYMTFSVGGTDTVASRNVSFKF